MQLYLRGTSTSVTRPLKELKGFKRITLEPGEKRRITFTLSVSQLAFYDAQMKLVVEPGNIVVAVGSSSEDLKLIGSFEVTGERVEIGEARVFFTRVKVE